MPTQSQLIAKFKKQSKGAWKRSRSHEAKTFGASLPGGIEGGLARLSSVKMDLNKNGDLYFMFKVVVHMPAQYRGVQDNQMITINETERKSVDDKTDDLSSVLQHLGVDTASMEEDDMGQILDDLNNEKPWCRYRTWQPDDGESRLFITGAAAAPPEEVEEEYVEDAEPEEYEDEVVEETEEPEEEVVEESEAEAGDDDDLFFTEGQAVSVGDGDENWTGTITGLSDDGQEVTVKSDDDGEEYECSVSTITVVETTEEPAEEPEATETEDDEAPPEKGDVCLCKLPRTREQTQCQVTTVNQTKQTVTLKRLTDNKLFKDIAWDKLVWED